MTRSIKSMEQKYIQSSLQLVETVFSEWDSPEEGKMVRSLVEEIRAKKYYIPELELIMVDETDEVIGYAMFSRFHLEGKYEDELLILTPVAVKTELQRQHISKDILEPVPYRVTCNAFSSFPFFITSPYSQFILHAMPHKRNNPPIPLYAPMHLP